MDAQNTMGDVRDGRDGAVGSASEMTLVPEGALVEILPGLLAVYGDIDLTAIDGAELLDVDVTGKPGLQDVVAGAVTGANIVTQAGGATMGARGLVRLAPQTLQALKTAQPLAKDGWNLGTLVSGGGKFAHSVRWLPATSAQAATVLVGLGPAVALFAISAQVSALSSNMRNIEGKLNALHAEFEARDWDRLKLQLGEVAGAYAEAIECGFEALETSRRIKALGKSQDLKELYAIFLRRVQVHRKQVQDAAVLVENHARITSDLRTLVAVSKACDIADLMKIGVLAAEDADKDVLTYRLKEFQGDLARRHDGVAEAVSPFRAAAHLVLFGAENPDGVGALARRAVSRAQDAGVGALFGRKGGQQVRPSLRGVVQEIDDVLEVLADDRIVVPRLPDPGVCDGDLETIGTLREALRWWLPQDEILLALVAIAPRGDDYLVVTTRRWARVNLKALVSHSGLDGGERLTDITLRPRRGAERERLEAPHQHCDARGDRPR